MHLSDPSGQSNLKTLADHLDQEVPEIQTGLVHLHYLVFLDHLVTLYLQLNLMVLGFLVALDSLPGQKNLCHLVDQLNQPGL